ncbi:MAG: hypothetical protein EON59_00560 [Alphaproteobacteria bacterium]|nr:MAG: hypothetical protein EON59_00560 [Alphaproteobacteria bacterium]
MAAKQYFSPFIPAFSSNGLPIAGAQIGFFLTGTTTPTPVYADSELETELENPVIANGAGRLPPIYLDSAITYRVRMYDAEGSQLDQIDPYIPGQALSGMIGSDGPVLVAGENVLDAAGGTGSALTVRPSSPGNRGEIQVIPNDDGAVDQSAGGEVTILERDTEVYGYTDTAAATFRFTRSAGVTVSVTFASLPNATTGQVFPLFFDASGGTIGLSLNTNGTASFYRSVTFGGSGADDVPLARLGPADQPALDYSDTTSSITYRQRVTPTAFELVRFVHVVKASGTISGNKLTVSSKTGGSIVGGHTVAGRNVVPGTTVVSQDSGTAGGAGVYTLSNSATGSGAILVPSTATFLIGVASSTIPWSASVSGTTITGALSLPGSDSTLATLELGPQSQPAIDFADSDSGKTWRIRNGTGDFSFYNETDGLVPFKLTATGHPLFANADTLLTGSGNNTPNAYLDPTTGEMKRAGWTKVSLPADATDLATAITLANAMKAMLISYGIAS